MEIDTVQALDLIVVEVGKARLAARNAKPAKRVELQRIANTWQSCLELCTKIYHEDGPDAHERIMALKLHCKWGWQSA